MTVDTTTHEGNSRRNFLKKGAFGAAAAAAASVAGVAGAGSANAANGGNFLIGSANSGTATTALTGGSTLKVSGGTSDAGASIYGVNGGATASASGVRGDATSFGVVGVFGNATASGTSGGATGVLGQTANPANLAMQAYHSGGGTALLAQSTSGPSLRIAESTIAAMPPTTGSWTAGSLVVKGGQLWYCRLGGAGTASKWTRVSSGLALLPVPKRAYDSRTGGGPRTTVDSDRTISLATFVPALSSAALITITAIGTIGAGYLTAYKGGTTYGGGRSVSWSRTGDTLTASATTAVNSTRTIKVRAGGATHFLIDVVGYYT